MADVSATLDAWSTTAGSNNPSGSTVIGSGLDDNLRQIQATVRLLASPNSIVSATTTDLSTVADTFITVSGTTTITALGTVTSGLYKWLIFSGALTLTHNAASLILPGAANVTTAAGDMALVLSLGSGNWRCLTYVPAILPPTRSILATKQASTSGTSIDFTGIPSWAKKIIIQFFGVSTNGTSVILLQLGKSGGPETSGYLGSGSNIGAASVASANYTTGFGLVAPIAASALHGEIIVSLMDAANFTWVESAVLGDSGTAGTYTSAGSKSLAAALDRVRITTVNGTDAFDAGAINILYE